MEFIRKQIDTEIQRGKVKPEAIYGILRQLVDHIEPPTVVPNPVPVAKPAPVPTQHQPQLQPQYQPQHQSLNHLLNQPLRKLFLQQKRLQSKKHQLKKLNKVKTFVA